MASPPTFRIGRNPTPGTRLPYVLSIPAPGGRLVLATREAWPGNRDLFCYELPDWPEGATVVEEVAVADCQRKGASVQLTLVRRHRRRSLFVWVKKGERTMVFWRSERSMKASRPGVRVPQARGLDGGQLRIVVDTRERYAWRFTGLPVEIERRSLPVGDYAIFTDEDQEGGELVATVERKSSAEFASDAMSGKLGLALAELSAQPRAALVVEGRLSQLLKPGVNVRPGWLMNLVAGLQAANPNVPLLFAESPKLAGDLAYRWLAACLKLRNAATESRSLHDALGFDATSGAPSDPGREPSTAPDRAPAGGSRSVPAWSGPLFDEPDAWKPSDGRPVRLQDAPHHPADRRTLALERARCGEVWTLRSYSEAFGITKATAGTDLKGLVARGQLRALGNTRNRRFAFAGASNDVTERPADGTGDPGEDASNDPEA